MLVGVDVHHLCCWLLDSLEVSYWLLGAELGGVVGCYWG